MKLVIRRGIRTSILNIGWIIAYSSANRDSTPEKMFEKIFELCIREFRAKEEDLRATTAATSAFLRRVTITQWARRGGYQPAIGRPILGLCTRPLRARSAPLDARPPREIMDCHDATDNRLEDVDISTNRLPDWFSTSLFSSMLNWVGYPSLDRRKES